MDVNLVLLKKNGDRKSFPLPSSVTVIGRRHDCDLRIPLASVSKRHCQLHYDNGMLKVRDLGSRNGTLVNGKAVEEAVVKAGDFIKVGPLKFVLQINGEPAKIDKSAPAGASAGTPSAEPAGRKKAAESSGDFDVLGELDSADEMLESLPEEFDLSEDDVDSLPDQL